jgi:putative PEP-CTERM system TPR-repeat lipoprotein
MDDTHAMDDMLGSRKAKTLSCLAFLLSMTLLSACSQSAKSPEEYLARARESLEKGDGRTAVLEFKSALSVAPQSQDIRRQLADLYIRYENGAAAQAEIEKAIELGLDPVVAEPLLLRAWLQQGKVNEVAKRLKDDTKLPQSPEVLLLRGDIDLYDEHADKAKANFEAALKLAPDNAAAMLGLARVAWATSKMDVAREWVDKALAQDPKLMPAYLLAGDIKLFDGKAKEALEAYKRAETLNPFVPSPLVMQAKAHLSAKEFPAAKEVLERAHKTFKDSLYVSFYQGVTNFLAGEPKLAEDRFREVLSAMPEHLMSQFYMGILMYKKGNFEQAEEFLRRFSTANPEDMGVRKVLASIQIQRGEYDAATATLDTGTDDSSVDAQVTLLRARALLESGNAQGASKLLNSVSAKDPGNQKLQLLSLLTQIDSGAVNDAIASLERSDRTKPSDTTQVLHIYALLRAQKWQEALKEADDMLARVPDEPTVLNAKGMILIGMGQPDAAKAAFSKAIERKPLLPAALSNLTLLELDTGDAVAAKTHVERMLELDPKSVAALTLAGRIDGALGQSDSATESFERARQLDSTALEARFRLTRYYLLNGRTSKAKEVADELYKIAPRDPGVLNVYGAALLASGKTADAVGAFKSGVQIAPNDAPLHKLLGTTYLDMGDIEQAYPVLKRAYQLAPSDVSTAIAYIRVLLARGSVDEAHGIAVKIEAFADKDKNVDLALGEVAAARGEREAAEKYYRRAVDKNPTTDAYLRLALIYAGSERKSEAATLLDQAVEKFPDDGRLVEAAAELNRNQGNLDAAEKRYRDFLNRHPDDVIGLNGLAYLMLSKKPQEGLVLAQKAYELAPQALPVMDTYGWALVQVDKIEEGLSILRSAAARAPESGEVLFHYGTALVRAKQGREAAKVLEQALAKGTFPSRKNAERLLADLRK